ncbi:MAG: carboxy terminal-processing peptidase [Bacteroidetes bacterium]|nr:carboxy terminal-processing peptidase [Bacteroidota bacterium]
MRRLLLPAILLLSPGIFAQQKNAMQQKAIVLNRFLEKNHYQPLEWNDSASAMLYNKWLEMLDEEKVFFTTPGIQALEPYRYKLDDEIRGSGWNFYNVSVAQYRQRLAKTDSIIKTLLAKPFDLLKPDNLLWPPSNYAANDAEFAQRWQKYLRWRVLDVIYTSKTDDDKNVPAITPAELVKEEATAREKVKKQELSYIKNKQTDLSELEDQYLDCVAWCYDPHSNYMNLKMKKEFQAAVSASEFSTGMDIDENEKGSKVVSFLQPGGSAWRSGQVHAGDEIVKVKVKGVEKDAADMNMGDVAEMMSGGSSEPVEVTLKTTTGEIRTVNLTKEMAADEEEVVKSYLLRAEKNIGYINLPGFYSRETDEQKENFNGCANDLSKEIMKLKKDSITGLIIDLRCNGGGSMWEAMQLAGIFIDIGPVASIRERDGKVHFLKDPSRGTIYDGPLMILVNGASASASEFFAAVMQDYNRALIVGSSTYGKGTAQVVLPMDTTGNAKPGDNTFTDFVKVTEDKFYRINGSTVQWKGVVPDISIPDFFSGDWYKEKANASALKPDNSKQGIYEQLKPLPVSALKAKSEQRLRSDSFQLAMNSAIKYLQENITGTTIQLQWPAYVAQKKKVADMFEKIREDDRKSTLFTVTNNNFDRQKVNASTQQQKDINEAYMDQIRSDRELEEAVNIMIDWRKL